MSLPVPDSPLGTVPPPSPGVAYHHPPQVRRGVVIHLPINAARFPMAQAGSLCEIDFTAYRWPLGTGSTPLGPGPDGKATASTAAPTMTGGPWRWGNSKVGGCHRPEIPKKNKTEPEFELRTPFGGNSEFRIADPEFKFGGIEAMTVVVAVTEFQLGGITVVNSELVRNGVVNSERGRITVVTAFVLNYRRNQTRIQNPVSPVVSASPDGPLAPHRTADGRAGLTSRPPCPWPGPSPRCRPGSPRVGQATPRRRRPGRGVSDGCRWAGGGQGGRSIDVSLCQD